MSVCLSVSVVRVCMHSYMCMRVSVKIYWSAMFMHDSCCAVYVRFSSTSGDLNKVYAKRSLTVSEVENTWGDIKRIANDYTQVLEHISHDLLSNLIEIASYSFT